MPKSEVQNISNIMKILHENNGEIPRKELERLTGKSKSRLSELLAILQNDYGYEFDKHRDGMVRQLNFDKDDRSFEYELVDETDVKYWYVLFILSILGKASSFNDIEKEISEHLLEDPDDPYYTSSTLRLYLGKLVDDGYVRRVKNKTYRNTPDNPADAAEYLYMLSSKFPMLIKLNEEIFSAFLFEYEVTRENHIFQDDMVEVLSLFSFAGGYEDPKVYENFYGRKNEIPQDLKDKLAQLLSLDFVTDCLEITYMVRSQQSKLTVAVGMFVYSMETNQVYILGKNVDADDRNIILRVDSVIDAVETDIENKVYHSEEFEQMYKLMYSVSLEEPKDIKILFRPGMNMEDKLNILKESRGGTADWKYCRYDDLESPCSKNDAEVILFTDRGIGIGDFARILRGFGSSAIVLEPQELRDLMLKSAERISNRYSGEDA